MPEINGYKLHDLLAADGFDIPTIFITAQDNAKSQAQAEKAGAVAYLTKPFDDEALLEAIRTVLGNERKTAGNRSRNQ
jgi:FixJ family two-component response regulator